MSRSFFGLVGLAGWLVLLLVWAGLVALVVWGISRLFPDRARPSRPRLARSKHRSSRVGSGRR